VKIHSFSTGSAHWSSTNGRASKQQLVIWFSLPQWHGIQLDEFGGSTQNCKGMAQVNRWLMNECQGTDAADRSVNLILRSRGSMRKWSAQKVRSRIQFQALDGSLGPIITCKQLLHIAVLERLMVFIGKRFGSAILATLWRYLRCGFSSQLHLLAYTALVGSFPSSCTLVRGCTQHQQH